MINLGPFGAPFTWERIMERPSLDEQIKYQTEFRNRVQAEAGSWPPEELPFAEAILESLERLRGLEH